MPLMSARRHALRACCRSRFAGARCRCLLLRCATTYATRMRVVTLPRYVTLLLPRTLACYAAREADIRLRGEQRYE